MPLFTSNICENGNFFGSSHLCVSKRRRFAEGLSTAEGRDLSAALSVTERRRGGNTILQIVNIASRLLFKVVQMT